MRKAIRCVYLTFIYFFSFFDPSTTLPILTERAEMYAALRGEKIGEAELEAIQRQAISPSYSNLGIRESRSRDQGIRETRSRGRSGSPIDARNRSTSDMSALGLGGAEDNRTPPRPPGSPKRSGSPYNRAQNPTAR